MVEDLSRVPYNLKQCPNCLHGNCKMVDSDDYPWSRHLQCVFCSPAVDWYVCLECNNMTVHMSTAKKLRRHFYLRHKKNCNDLLISKVNENMDAEKLRQSKLIKDDVVAKKLVMSEIFDSFQRAENSRFFSRQITGSEGISYLIARACFNDDTIGQEIYPLDVEINFSLAKLCMQLTRGEREMLSDILLMITKKFTASKNDKETLSISLPQTATSIRQRYMEGLFAVIPNLPHPEVKKKAAFAYVTLKDCVSDLLAHGVTLDELTLDADLMNDTVNTISQSEASKNIFRRSQSLEEIPDITLCILEWSDGFQPNTSTKQNRGGVYVKTVSFVVPKNTYWSNSTYTYCVAVGPSKMDAEPVENLFAEELKEFQNDPLPRFYSKSLNKIVTVYLEVLCVLQDQPERRKVNHLAFGNSNFHARWGWSCDFKSLKKILPSCRACRLNLLRGDDITTTTPCRECLNWNLDTNNPLCTYEPPNKYPQCCTEATGMLKPFPLSYNILQEAVDKAHNKIFNGEWKGIKARNYLKVFCLNSETIENVITQANNCRALHVVQDVETRNRLLTIRNRSPQKFQKWNTPAVWTRQLKLYQHIDTVMHLIFLGGTKTIMIDGHNWISSENKMTAFLAHSSDMYEEVQSLYLSWCKSLPYGTGKFGAHVSENYLSCARLMKWFYQPVKSLYNVEEAAYVEPDTPQEMWTKLENQGWLRRHGFPTNGNAATVRRRVEEHRNIEGETDQLVPTLKETAMKFESVIVSWVALVSRIMQESVDGSRIKEIHQFTKIFLSFYNDFDSEVTDDKTPVWIRHFNFLSFLNIPDVIDWFGPMRNVWEGGICGEAIIAFIKPEITMGLRKNWETSLLKRVHRKKAFESIEQSNRVNSIIHEIEESKFKKGCYKTYSGRAEVIYQLDENKPISCILIANFIYLSLHDNKLLKIEIRDFKTEVWSLCYFEISVTDEVIDKENVDSIIDYGLLLPLRNLYDLNIYKQNNEYVYTLITQNWNELSQEKQLILPHIDVNLIHELIQ